MANTIREIKFKALTEGDNPKWVFGHYFFNGMTQTHTIQCVDYFQSYTENIDPKTLCQFIGSSDGLNNDIYEGDIVSWEDEDGELYECVIEYYDIYSAFCLTKLHSMSRVPFIIGRDCNLSDIRVIDNKFN